MSTAIPPLSTAPAAPSGAAGRTASAAPAAPLITAARRLFTDTVQLSAEAMARLRSEQQNAPTGGSTVSTATADLRQAMQRPSLALTGTVDLSREAPAPDFHPHADDFADLLAAPGLGEAERTRLASALDMVTVYDQQVSNDPAIDLAARRMKLDYVRDNLVPAALRPQADAAIAAYMTHRGADQDQMSAQLTQASAAIARATGRSEQAQALDRDLAAYASGGAPSQQYRDGILSRVQGQQYGTPAQASAAADHAFAALHEALLAAVSAWPRDQERGRAAAEAQIARLRTDWNAFTARV